MIDSHVHVWTLEPDKYPWHLTLPHVPIPSEAATAEHLLDCMDEAQVAQAVLVQPSVYGWDNSYLCGWIDRMPDRFIGVCLVDPHSKSAADDLRYWCTERGCRGIRINLIAEGNVLWVADRTLDSLWLAAQEADVVVSFQMRPSHVPVVTLVADRHPNLRVVIDYLGSDAYHDGSGCVAVNRLAEHANIWFKILASGPDSRESYPFRDLWPVYQQALMSFTHERLVFGSDFPHVLRSCTYEQAVSWLDAVSFLDPAARLAIATTNARRLWRSNDISRRMR